MLRQVSQAVARRPAFLSRTSRLASGFTFRWAAASSTVATSTTKNASFQRLRRGVIDTRREFCTSVGKNQAPPVVEVDYEELMQLSPAAINCLREAFMGPKAYGAIAVRGIPEYGEKRKRAFRAGIDLALTDPEGRARAAAVNNTYPGWSGTPGSETHPLQSSFLFNVKEELGRTNDYFGKNIFPSEDFRKAFVDLSAPMHEAALQVLKGCDVLVEVANGLEGNKWSSDGRSLHRLALDGPALAGRFICYDSAFTREDTIFEDRDRELKKAAETSRMASTTSDSQNLAGSTWSPSATTPMGTHSPASTQSKLVGHASDGLASMRTHSTPVKSVGHAGDGLASMRTHSTPVKTAGHAGDGLASMRTHSTPVKSAGHAGDGLASMRTHSTPVKSVGHAGDGLASMRTHSTPVKTAGHAGDGLASMRTHSTPVKSAGHAGDGLASMRTHSTPVKTAGHAGDGLASMRTHSTPVKSAGHAGDGLASMRTHSTPVKSAGHAGDGLASMRTHSTPVKSVGHSGMKGDGPAFMQTHTQTHAGNESGSVRMHSTQMVQSSTDPIMDFPVPLTSPQENVAETKKDDVGDYWLPWHIDSNFVTLIHKEMYAYESDASFAPEPKGAGVVFMNPAGDTTMLDTEDDALMILQIGAFGQIYSGGHINACRHAVLSTAPEGIARFNFCNFWYVPWDTVCHSPPGREQQAVSTGWNAMMDESYLGISMRQSFAAFRKFMTSPEARLQFADSVRFKELAEVLPVPRRASSTVSTQPHSQELVLDVMTDLRCPISYISLLNLDKALQNLGLSESTTVRYHPLFLNPNVPKEGESLDVYLLREFGYSKEYARSETYPLRLLGLEAGVNFNPDRRVVNTFNAACVVEMAQEVGKQRQMVEVLSRSYFEDAKDISDVDVLCELASSVGFDQDDVRQRLQASDGPLQKRVSAAYTQFSEQVDEVPHFMVREHVSGNGVEVGGRRSVENWEGVLQAALEKGRFVGMTIPGLNGEELRLAEANPNSPISLAFNAQHGWAPNLYPYSKEDFGRMDESPDTMMYAEPRFVQHLDEQSLARLTSVYRAAFAQAPAGFSVLDLCSSWTSHFPEDMPKDARIVVHGLNEAEVKANVLATETLTQDLNAKPTLPLESDSFHFVTNALSVQYLTDPLAVFAEMHRVLKPGGMAIIAFSHRTFIEKAVNVWAKETDDGEGHAHLIGRHFQFGPVGGWKHLSSIDVSPSHGDPMWLVTAVKAY